MVLHPLQEEYSRLLDNVLPVYEKVVEHQQQEPIVRTFTNEYIGLYPTAPPGSEKERYTYRNKIKGYHLAFNVHDPLAVKSLSKY